MYEDVFQWPQNDFRRYLMHCGVKGQKWNVKNGPPYPIKRDTSSANVIVGHVSTPRKSDPNSITDHKDDSGKVDKRTYYGDNGLILKEIHTTDHKRSKYHNYGNHGEHAHDFIWNDDGTIKEKTTRELRANERKENEDIL